jgi:hypothetical protein
MKETLLKGQKKTLHCVDQEDPDGLMKKIEFYIHAGTGKTGTSAIQGFFNANRSKLIKYHACLYPDFETNTFSGPQSGSKGQHNHCPVFRKENRDTCEERLREFIFWVKRTNFKKVIISCEFLMEQPELVQILSRVFQGEAEIHCVIIVYLRRQDNRYESGWKQSGIKKFRNIQEYIEHKELFWDNHLDIWADAFGLDNIVVHPYEKQQLKEGLIYDFLRIIGIDPLSEIWNEPGKNNLNINRGFTRDIMEIMYLNRDFYKKNKGNTVSDFFEQYLPDCYKKAPFELYSFLSPNERINILKRYSDMNEYIARKYLRRSNGVMFIDPWPQPDEPWVAYEGLTVEKVIPIFIQIMYNMDKRYNILERSVPEKSIKRAVQNYINGIITRVKSLNI